MSYDDYAAWDAINFHILNYFRYTASHARCAMTSVDEEKKHLAFGLATHIAVLEPQRFDEEVLVTPKLDRRTKAGKAAWAEFQKKAEGRHIVQADEFEALQAIKRNCLNHPTVTEILHSEGANEISLIWKDWDCCGAFAVGRSACRRPFLSGRTARRCRCIGNRKSASVVPQRPWWRAAT